MSKNEEFVDNNQRFCLYCGKPFEYNRYQSNKKFCDKECREAYYGIESKKDTFIMKECAFCKKAFKCSGSTPNKLYCSKECSQAFYKEKYKTDYIPKKAKENIKEVRKCEHCGKEFEWTSFTANKKYCSPECLHESTQQRIIKGVSSEKRNCAFCGKEFDWISKKPTQKYCGKECLQSATLIKIKNHQKRNNDSIVELRNIIYLKVSEIIGKMNQSAGDTFGNKYIDYWLIGDISEKTRDAVLKRDGYECQICRRKDMLHLHHLIKRKNGGKHNLDNLITLCASCHRHIETGDIEHATNTCLKNAKKYYYNIEENNDIVDISNVKPKLIALFDKLKDVPGGTNAEIMIQLDEIIDIIESIDSQ